MPPSAAIRQLAAALVAAYVTTKAAPSAPNVKASRGGTGTIWVLHQTVRAI
jgi:hypothetical protein